MFPSTGAKSVNVCSACPSGTYSTASGPFRCGSISCPISGPASAHSNEMDTVANEPTTLQALYCTKRIFKKKNHGPFDLREDITYIETIRVLEPRKNIQLLILGPGCAGIALSSQCISCAAGSYSTSKGTSLHFEDVSLPAIK